MNTTKKNSYFTTIILAVVTILYIVLIKTIDVAPIGPEGTRVGWSHINQAVHELTGVSMFWYKLTSILGILAIFTGLFFAGIGIIQLLQRKSFLRVDRSLRGFGLVIVCLAFLYVLFEIVVINYRPVIMEGSEGPEASFPSSHTMLIAAIAGATAMLIGWLVKNESLRKLLQILCIVIIFVGVIGRLLSGVHWLTDIIGGVLISAVLLTGYHAFLKDS